MSDSIYRPSVRYKIIINGQWACPKMYIDNIEDLMMLYLFKPEKGWCESGFEILYDENAWNIPELVDNTFQIFTWIEGIARIIQGENINFGILAGTAIVHSNMTNIVFQIDQQYMIDRLGKGLPERNYDYSGVSGGIVFLMRKETGFYYSLGFRIM